MSDGDSDDIRQRAAALRAKVAEQMAVYDMAALLARLVTVENDPTVPAYARKVAADAVRAMEGE